MISNCSFLITAASCAATKYESAGTALTRKASSAPIASALRIVGSEVAGPTCATVTDLTPADASSFNSRARVSESSSHGLITHWIPAVSSLVSLSTNLTFVVVSGTLLMQTKIFIDGLCFLLIKVQYN